MGASTFGPYTPVKQAGNYYFVSGQIGVDPLNNAAAKDIEIQTKQAVSNLKAALQEAGLSFGDVVKTTVFLTDISNFAAMNEVYEQAFPAPRPARSTVAVRELPRVADEPLLVEIEAVAYKENS
jgi:2-iminobutanoate/2-iminopropanoate deaminase